MARDRTPDAPAAVRCATCSREVGRRPARAPGARRPDGARHGGRHRRARRDARPVEDRRRNQIVGRFDAVAATDIVVSPARRRATTVSSVLPVPRRGAPAAPQRRRRRRAASRTSTCAATSSARSRSTTRSGCRRSSSRSRRRRPGCGERCARTCPPAASRTPGTRARADRVVVLGRNAAARLNINRVDQQPAVFLGDRLYLVDRHPRPASSASRRCSARSIMPEGTAAREYGLRAPGLAQIETRVGAVDADRAPGAARAQPDAAGAS